MKVKAFQAEYQEYEAARIAEGLSLYDEQLYAGFYNGRPAIATPVGTEEWVTLAPIPDTLEAAPIGETRILPTGTWVAAWSVFGAGFGAMIAVLFALRVSHLNRPTHRTPL